MSETNDYSRQRFADFLAARIRAKRIETEMRQQPSRTVSPRVEEDRARIASNPDSRLRGIPPFGRARHRLSEPGSSN
jgi:hypothetical protein